MVGNSCDKFFICDKELLQPILILLFKHFIKPYLSSFQPFFKKKDKLFRSYFYFSHHILVLLKINTYTSKYNQFHQQIEHKNLIIKYFFLLMFKASIQPHKNKSSFFSNFSNQNSFFRQKQGYDNYDSPMRATFRLQASPRKSLSPLKINTSSRTNINKSKSPIIFSKQSQNSASRVSPFKRSIMRNEQELYDNQNMSFTNLIRKNSNNLNDKNLQSKRALQHSTSNYLVSDRNVRQNTNLFRQLANKLQSSNPNQGFYNSKASQNSVKYQQQMPQSTKNYNQNLSCKNYFINNVQTIQSIQSPEQRDFIQQKRYYSQLQKIQTNQYEVYQRLTTQCNINKKPSSKNENLNFDQSKYSLIEGGGIPTFKKISLNQRNACETNNELQQSGKPIDFHLTNSFGTINIKNNIIGQYRVKKQFIKPFYDIQNIDQVKQDLFTNNEELIIQPESKSQKLGLQAVQGTVNESNDSIFASLHMILQKMNEKQCNYEINKQNESINMSMSQNQSMELDMEPYLPKKC